MSEHIQTSSPIFSDRRASHFSADDDVDIRALIMMLWRRRVLILVMVMCGIGLGFAAVHIIEPVYKARGLVLIETAQHNYGRTAQTAIKTSPADTTIIMSELQVLRSRSLAAHVVAQLNEAQGPYAADSGKSFKALSVQSSDFKTLPPEAIDPQMVEAVNLFLENLIVRVLPGSSVLQVEFAAHDPARAALITNMLIDIYIHQRSERFNRDHEKFSMWHAERRADLRTQLRDVERSIESYKARHHLIEDSQGVMSDDQLSRLHVQLAEARAEKAAIEAHLSHMKKVQSGAASLDSVPEVLNSDILRKLRLDAVKLEGALSELSKRYGERHPQMITARAELEELNRAIYAEMLKSLDVAKSNLALAEAHIAALEKDMQALKGQRYEDSDAMIGLRELEREAQSIHSALGELSKSNNFAGNEKDIDAEQARVISHAVVPSDPVFPNKKLILSLSALLSMFTGLGLVLVLEKLDNSFRTPRQLEVAFSYPCFALIPKVKHLKAPHVSNYVLKNAASIVAETVRTLRMVMNLRAPDSAKPKVVALTSSLPGEGKTTLSIWMARLAAKSGEKVIIVDTDLRRPNVHKSVGQKNTRSIVEYLTGKASLKDVIQKDALSGADMIYARSVPASALDLVGSAKMAALVEQLRSEYDLVILDTPACLAVSDARILAKMADQTLYAVSWNGAPRDAVANGVKHFTDLGHKSLAFVLTNVDVRRHVRYGYGDTVYYYNRD